MTGLAFTRLSVVVLAVTAIVGCSSGAPSTVGPGATTAPSTRAPATPAGGPSNADGLCGVFTPDLAIAALGGPVDTPSGGDVVPRPNGIYCRYPATGDANSNVEAQFKDQTRDEFEAFEDLIEEARPLSGVGEVAFARDASIMGLSGAFVGAWAGGRGVTVSINREGGDQAQMLAAAQAIAAAVLASSP